jgi:hypothetical protein
LQGYADEGFPGTARGSVPQCKVGSEEDCKTNLKNAFIENRLKNSCDEFTNSIENRGDVSVFLCLQDDYDGFPDDQPACSENPESWHYTCGQNSGDDLYSKFSEDERLTQVKLPEPYVAPCPTSNPPQSSDPVCAALGKDSSSRVTLSVRFNDLRDENRVDPDYQNRFCADIRIMHHSS